MAVSVGEGDHARRNQYKTIRYERAGSRGDSSRRGCEGLAEFTLHGGMYEEMYSGTWEAPDIVSYSNTRTWVEYPDRESACSGVADVLGVLRGRESLLHGEGGHGRTQPAQETSAGHAGSETRSQPHCGEEQIRKRRRAASHDTGGVIDGDTGIQPGTELSHNRGAL